jgi:hypothetical protein
MFPLRVPFTDVKGAFFRTSEISRIVNRYRERVCVCLCVYIYCPFLLLPCFLMFIGILPERKFPSRCRQNALGDQHRVFGTLQSIASCVQDKTKQNKTKKANKKKSWGINRVLCERERARESECAFLFVCVSV